MRVLLDTCVIIDAMQNRGRFATSAQALLVGSAECRFEACASSKQICDIYYILHRVYHDDTRCREVLNDLFDVVEVVDCSAAAIVNARISALGDFEDAVLAECAREAGCDFIATSNMADFKKSELKALDPAQACKLLGLDA